MHVRIARFEGVDVGSIDEEVEEMRKQMQATELPPDAPAELQTLMETVGRFVQLVDRDKGVTLGLAFSKSGDDMRRADEALNTMSPPSDAPRSSGTARPSSRARRSSRTTSRAGRRATARRCPGRTGRFACSGVPARPGS